MPGAAPNAGQGAGQNAVIGPVRVLVAAGATGGHVMPALTMAGAIAEARPGSEFLFVGTGRPAEERILARAGHPRRILDVSGLKGRGLPGLVKGTWRALRALKTSADLVREFRPHLGLVTGGYVTGPVGLALKMASVPVVVHEQNSRPGLTNRLLGRIADLILVAFPEAASSFPAKRVVVAGNPVRPEIAALRGLKRDFAAKPATLLIMGGSQGSRRLNLAGTAMVASLLARGAALRVIHQSGAEMAGEVAEAYRRMGAEAEVAAFIDDMAGVYRRSHLAVCRAGALTVFELAAAGLPAVLVPLPTAADDHQTINARALERLGLARLVPEGPAGGAAGGGAGGLGAGGLGAGGLEAALVRTVGDLLDDRLGLEAMAASDTGELGGLGAGGGGELAGLILAQAAKR
jgi:UDP-N-acetylglucosamine--N-acetylmuramyl-(pentapeptide) pyrophosphoryl-undecaprenol N-acetylglucosamine transferase